MSKKLSILLTLVFALSLILSACAKTATPTAAPAPEQPTKAPAAPTKAPEPTKVPEPTATAVPAGPMGVTAADLQGVTVEFWHVWHGRVGDALQAMVDDFNATNEYGITVEAFDQGGYGDIYNNMNAAINTGELPDIAVGYNNQFASWNSAGGVIVNMNDYVNDPNFGLSADEQADFYPQFWQQDFIGDARSGIPVQRSLSFMYYNTTWAKELGFDAAPTTPDEFKAQACAAAAANNADDNPDNDGTGGWFLNTGASTISAWIWAFGGEIQNADGYTFNTPEAQAALTFLKSLYDEGCAWTPESRYPNAEFATRQGLFYTSSIAGLPYQAGAQEDAGSTDEWTVVPFPSITGTPVMDVYGPSYTMVTSTPEEQLAAWLFIKWFVSPENQAKWIEASAYYPTRASTLDYLGDYIAANPQWAASRELIQYGKTEPRWESWSSVRYAAGDEFAKVFQADFTVDQLPDLLAGLDATAAELHAETQP